MSDCTVPEKTYEKPEMVEIIRLTVEFNDGTTWSYPIHLNGRKVTGVYAVEGIVPAERAIGAGNG